MQVKITKNFKSFNIETKMPSDLPDFTILTGENGSGKTHFLSAIQKGNIIIFDNDAVSINTTDIIIENFQTVQSKISDSNGNVFTQASNTIYSAYINLINSDTIPHNQSISIGNKSYTLMSLIEELFKYYNSKQLTISQITDWLYFNKYKIKPFETQLLPSIFFNYYLSEMNNLMKKNNNEPHLNDEEFKQKYGEKPWDILNDILHDKAKLNFKFIKPEISDFQLPYNVTCKNNQNISFKISDLSNGEKVILLIAFSLFSSIEKKLVIPKIILLDEIDCSLHPSMIRNLLYLLEDVFVKEYKIKVILTTHSPTTVALAKEESLYYVQADQNNRIIKKNKDEILKNLAHGIPTLCMSYINRKNVITESHYDADNMCNIYNILVDNRYIKNDISLNFISSGTKTTNTGSCDNVKHLVSSFYDNGNKNIYGIVDWDLKNIPTDRILVLAEKERYSIENCILDPLLIALLLLYNPDFKYNPKELGLPENFVLTRNIPIFESNAETVINSIIIKMNSILQLQNINIKTTVSYIGGLKLEIPKSFLEYNGHSLEDTFKNTFPELKRYTNQNELKKVIINLLNQYPHFIPNCFFVITNKIISD